jgi:uncharacterized membrane protein YbhN (UPF0104 family)
MVPSPQRLKRWALRYTRYLAGAAVSAAFVLLFLRKVDFAEVGRTMARANLFYLAPIVGFFMLGYFLEAVRWRHLVRHIANVSTRDAFPRVLVSQTAGLLLPFQLGQVLMVQISAETFQIGRTELFGAEFISRLMDGFVFAVFLAIALATLPIGSGFTGLTVFMLLGTITGFVLVWWITGAHPHFFADSWFPLALRRLHETVLHPLLQGLSSIRDWRQTRDVLLLSVAIWSAQALYFWTVGLALGLHAHLLAYFFLAAAANIGAGIPLAQAGVGFIFLAQQALVAVGEPLNQASAYALSLQALTLAPIIVLGPLAVYSMHLTWRDVIPFGGGHQARPVPDPERYGGADGPRPERHTH